MALLLRVVIAFVLCLTIPAKGAATFDLLPPSGHIVGSPSLTIGWGYTLSNMSTSEWLVPTGLNSSGFQYGHPISLFDFPVLGPGSFVLTPYFEGISGLMEIRLNDDVPPDVVDEGFFTVQAEWWSDDPAAGGIFVRVAEDLLTPYSVGVQAVPEPSTAGPTVIGGLGIILTMKLRRSRQ